MKKIEKALKLKFLNIFSKEDFFVIIYYQNWWLYNTKCI